jgi:GH15 family glucan-1,4-alpha-glucosidase
VSTCRSTEIAGLAFLSDCHSAALVDGQGDITWMCLPRFDSGSVFGALLDPTAGHWRLGAAGLTETTRVYVPDTLVLQTTFQTPTGRAVLTDALLVGQGDEGTSWDCGRRMRWCARSPSRRAGSPRRAPSVPGATSGVRRRCGAPTVQP